VSLRNLFKLAPSEKTVHISPANVEFKTSGKGSILEAGLAQGLAMPHSCTVGTCGTCKCKLLKGKIREMTNFAYVLSSEDLQNNYILTCQAAAKSDVEIQIEDFEPKRLTPPEDFEARITATRDITHDIKEVTLKLDRPMHFDAGQYIQLTTESIFGARSYSFAMAPESRGNETISLFIRKVPEGEFTGALFAGALDNVTLKAHGPSGNFWLREGRGPMLCISGGSGLAPIISMLEQAIKNPPGRTCIVLFGARTQADLYGIERLKEIEQKWDGAFNFVPVLSDEPEDSGWQGARGFVNTAIGASAGHAIGDETDIYMCGPPPMIDAATETLIELGANNHRIHFDKFLDSSHGIIRND
jgi:p-cymene monooxygenase electron transfer component